MNKNPIMKRTTILAALATFGLATAGFAGAARADTYCNVGQQASQPPTAPYATGHWVRVGNRYEWRTTAPVNQPVFWVRDHRTGYATGYGYDYGYDRDRDRDGRYRGGPIDMDGDGRIVTYERLFYKYDRNRDRRLEGKESVYFWSAMGESGAYGHLTSAEIGRLGNLGDNLDRNHDGRLLGAERQAFDDLNIALRRFSQYDRNGDHYLTRYEAGRTEIGAHFWQMDRNRDRLLSGQEVRDAILAAFVRGQRIM